MSRLPIQTRLFLALATVALLPVLVFGVVDAWRAGSASTAQVQSDALALARVEVAGLPVDQLPDQTIAGRLATMAGGSVTVFAVDGVVQATAGDDPPASLPEGAAQAASGMTTASGGSAIAVVPVHASSGQTIGYLALVMPITGSSDVAVVLAFALTLTVLWALFLSFAFAGGLISPMRQLTQTLDRLQAGDLSARVVAPTDDELGRLAASHNRLAAALSARNESLHQVLEALAALSPSAGIEPLVTAAERAATSAFGFRSVEVVLSARGDRRPPLSDERVPGEAWTIVEPLRLGDDEVGWLRAIVPPMRDWGPADADLLALFARQLAAAIRNAQLYAETRSLSELKSEFLRGVSHNLQTPLTSIRAFAERLASHDGDRAARIIVEQADRLSRLVAQLLTVSRIEAGTLRPREEVVALAPMVRRAWESLGHDEIAFDLRDDASGWLAIADRDWVDQVVWALLDNAVKHGGGAPVEVTVSVRSGAGVLGAVARGAVAGAGRGGVAVASADRGPGHGAATVIAGGALLVPTSVAAHPTSAAALRSEQDDAGREAGSAMLDVVVRDHGPGVAAEMKTRIFDRFATGAASGGTGLGLNVARGLVEAMGGTIRVEHPDDGGAAFAFTLPAERADEA
ncbi:MAG: ATP-binding protein [Chloroflexi bacterium]|nr:ATP-binding protein [Chloroflexota bacterium]